MRNVPARVALLVALTCGTFGACFEPPILPPLSAESGASGQPSGDAGDGATPVGGVSEPASGGVGTSTAGAAGKSMAGGGAGGVAGSDGVGGTAPGVTWLELDGNRAPGSSPVNAELGIEGSVYAYRDGCASLEWDEQTRCATGKLCDAGFDFENWGIAVGFDFKNTGAAGDPPNTKLLWDPRDVGAKGFAWRITGSAPGLQVWVLNMDPRFGGACSAETCEISGPPDGDASAPLVGQLLLSSMQKDDWNGGVDYDFDPAQVHALQIKLPAIQVGAASFAFCIEALGIVR